jgi:hypothetical protein
MKNDKAAHLMRTDVRRDVSECEQLIRRACSSDTPDRVNGSGKPPYPVAAGTPNVRARRDSLTEAMIGLILGPDAF